MIGWKELLARRQERQAEELRLERALADVSGRPVPLRSQQPRRWFGLTAFEWNLLRIIVLWSFSLVAIGFAIGRVSA